MSLLWRVLASNALVIGVATTFLSLSPASVPAPGSPESILILLGGMTLVLLINLILLRRVLDPLRRLTLLMHRIDPMKPGERVRTSGHDAEVVDLARAFNGMLERLEAERRDATRRAVDAQEGERQRIARELHDEVGQCLTAALLQLEAAAKVAPPALGPRLAEVTETVRSSLREARAVAARLRPEALDDLGLVSAIRALADRLAQQTGLSIDLDVESDLPALAPQDEIVVYRVAQEALTNVLRHAQASHVHVRLLRAQAGVQLCVVDDGVGLDGVPPGAGMLGMRERAVLIGARLTFDAPANGGTSVTLDIPAE